MTRSARGRAALAAIATVITVMACAGADPTPSPSAEIPAAAIGIEGFTFDPPSLTVEAGTIVTWTNREDAFHTVTSGTPEAPDGAFDSGEMDTDDTFEHAFPVAGTYAFFCTRHPFMDGVVVVGP